MDVKKYKHFEKNQNKHKSKLTLNSQHKHKHTRLRIGRSIGGRTHFRIIHRLIAVAVAALCMFLFFFARLLYNSFTSLSTIHWLHDLNRTPSLFNIHRMTVVCRRYMRHRRIRRLRGELRRRHNGDGLHCVQHMIRMLRHLILFRRRQQFRLCE